MNTEILKGLSIEELEERAEFTAVTDELPTGYEGMDDAAKQSYWKTGCKCNCG